MLWLIAIFVLNLLISAWNAYAVGFSWAEAKVAGGWTYIMARSGAIMSACGFTWCYLVLASYGGVASGYLEQDAAETVFKLGYLIIILPVLGSGFAIWAESLARAWRERSLLSGGVAAYNTFAQLYNTYQAVSAIPQFLGDVSSFFSSDKERSSKDDAKGSMAMLVIFLAIFAVFGGVITTATIIRYSARKSAITSKFEIARERATA